MFFCRVPSVSPFRRKASVSEPFFPVVSPGTEPPLEAGGLPQTTTMTIRVPIETMDRLVGVSRSTERSKSYLANEAIEEAVKEADSENADFRDHADVLARMKKKVAAANKR